VTDTAAARPPRPRIIETAAGLLAAAALGAVITGAILYPFRQSFTDWIRESAAKSNQTLPADLPAQVSRYLLQQLIVGIVVAVLLLLIARMAMNGKPGARWLGLGLYVLATLTTTFGIGAILSIGASQPWYFKVPALLTSLCFLAGVLMLNLRPSTEWLNFGRPAPAARGGLFGPRPAGGPGSGGPVRRSGGLFGRPPARTVDVEPAAVQTEPVDRLVKPKSGAPAPVATPKPAAGARKGRSTAKSRRS
jgi:hypothetical protein